MPKVFAHKLRELSRDDLQKELAKYKKELAELRVAQVTGGAAGKMSQIRVARKNIARCLTVFNQTQRDELRKHYAGKKHIPIDLRPRYTRAMRRALTKEEKDAKTLRQLKKEAAFPKRVYALRA